MWEKIFVIISLSALVLAKEPRKLYKTFDDENLSLISPLRDPFDGIEYRLPNNSKPLSYDVWLSTNIHLGEFGFNGRVTIEINVTEVSSSITVHYRELTIINVNLLRGTGGTIQPNVAFDEIEQQEFLVIKPTRALSIGIYKIEINYEGFLRNDDAGFYRSSYTDISGNRKWIATTQFESTDARHAFPCYDEPAIRSRYTVRIRHHDSYHALGNMPVESVTTEPNNYVTTKFEEIQSVQSYLIAFVVSDFDYVQDLTSSVPQRVFARNFAIANGYGKLAIDVSGDLLKGFEDYLNVSYSLPKMDQIAIPDFAAGAMENWGLVTYREQYLLFNPTTGTTRDRENIVATIAHEFAHQWFGNLIAPAWWSYLWLNEGFATLYENHLTELVFPGERWDDTFLIDTFQPVMETDSNANIRAMTHYVENPDRIDNLFDSVAYSKSGSVLRMFQNTFGHSVWQKGLNNYLNAKAYDAAIPDDLYAGIQKAFEESDATSIPDVRSVMRTFELQSGFPYLNVSRSGNTLTFEQNRFMYSNRNSQNLWLIPIGYVVESNPDFSDPRADFFMPNTRTFQVQSASAPKPFTANEWIIVNTQQAGYYRVNYDNNLWDLIVEKINSETYSQVHVFNRAQLIDDSFHLARAGLISFQRTFEIFNYLEYETDYIPWSSANRANTLLNRWISGSDVYFKYQAFMRKNVDALYKRLGIKIIADEPRVDRYARMVAVNIACQSQHPTCLAQTTERLQNLIDTGNALAPDEVSTIYCNGIRESTAPLFNAIRDKAVASTVQSERNTIFSALGCVNSISLLSQYLIFGISPLSTLTTSERSRILTSAMNNGEKSVEVMIFFLSNNFDAIRSYGLVPTMCSSLASRILSQNLFTLFDELLTVLVDAGAITQAASNTYRNNAMTIVNWKSENLGAVEGYFAGLDDTTPEPTSTQSTTPTPTQPTTSTQAITSTQPVTTTDPTTNTQPTTTTEPSVTVTDPTTSSQPATSVEPSTPTTTLGAGNIMISVSLMILPILCMIF